MRAADFMRTILNAIDSAKQAPAAPPTIVININNGEATVDAHKEPVSDETDVFVPPLQQKIELLKKSSGVQSVYDEAAGEDEPFDG